MSRDEEARGGKTGASPLRAVRIFPPLADEVAGQKTPQDVTVIYARVLTQKIGVFHWAEGAALKPFE